MAGLKIKINQPEPSQEVIGKYKDFNSLMDGYKKYYTTGGIRQMLYKDRKKLVYIVIIVIFLLLMLFWEESEASTLAMTLIPK